MEEDRTQTSVNVVEEVVVKLNPQSIAARLHGGRLDDTETVARLVERVENVIRPAACYRTCYVDGKEDEAVILEGVRFASRVLRTNLENVWKVFPYVVTIGEEFDELTRDCPDLLEKYYLDAIGNLSLAKAQTQLGNDLKARFRIEKISHMNPGSLNDWPIEQQEPLFSILGDVLGHIGVKLSPTFLMEPAKSLSGIFFPTETPFESCQLCPRRDCPARRAAYDARLVKRYGITPETES
ncbi:MAG: vitamin B12 dependent methionine synthase [Deltaproteobacteria bacterium]